MYTSSDNIYAPPQSKIIDDSKPFELCVDGKFVVSQKNTNWGDRCYRCNVDGCETVKEKMIYQPKVFLYALLSMITIAILLGNYTNLHKEFLWSGTFLSGIVLMILTAIMTRRVAFQVPICQRHRQLKRRLAWIIWLLIIVFGVMLFLLTSFAIVVFIPLFVVVLISSAIDPRLMIAKKQDDLCWIKGTSVAFRDDLPEFR